MRLQAASAVLVACLMAGCVAPPPPNPAELVPADIIINTVKCEVAQLVSDLPLQTPRRMVVAGQDFTVGLKLKAVVKVSGGLNAEGGLSVLALNGAVPAVAFGASSAATSTVDTKTDFTLQGRVIDDLACRDAIKAGRILQNGIGYYVFMRQLGNDLNKFIVGDPKIIADQFTYDATFGVTRKFDGSIKYGFVPLSVKGSAEATDDSVQQITITVKNLKSTGAAGATFYSAPFGAAPKASAPRCPSGSCLPPAIPFIRPPDAPL